MNGTALHQRWQSARRDELAGTDSWLGLIGLTWLEPGTNAVGSAADCTVRLPSGPDHLGSLRVIGSDLSWQAAAASGARVQAGGALVDGWQILFSDRKGHPSRVAVGALEFFVIEREGRLAARLRNCNWAAGRMLPLLDVYDYDPAWRIEALWQPLAVPQRMEVPTVAGDLKIADVTHRAVFEMAGETIGLLPVSVDDAGVFFVFRDRSSGRETYGAGRFLKVPVAVDGKITLDFNFAYNPPCAFTPFATCPLPPPDNWLHFAVPAGEKKWDKGV